MEGVTWKLTLPYGEQPAGMCCVTQETHWGSVSTSRGRVGREMGRSFKREGTCVCLWLIHLDV